MTTEDKTVRQPRSAHEAGLKPMNIAELDNELYRSVQGTPIELELMAFPKLDSLMPLGRIIRKHFEPETMTAEFETKEGRRCRIQISMSEQ